MRQLIRHRPKTRYTDNGYMQALTKAFGRRKPNPQSGETTWSCRHDDGLDMLYSLQRPRQEVVKGRHEPFEAFRSRRHKILRHDDPVFLHEGHAILDGRCIQGQNHGLFEKSVDIVIKDDDHEEYE